MSHARNPAARSLILFDIDGTLLKGAGRHHKDALLAGILEATGHSASFDGIDTAGMLDRDLIEMLLVNCGVRQADIQTGLIETMHCCQTAYLANCAGDLSAFLCPHVRETLLALQSWSVPLGLVTGNLSAIAWKKMELAGIREFFSIGAFAEDGATRAALAALAAERARAEGLVGENPRISLVGDHANDITAARANGFQSVAVASGVTPVARLATHDPDILVEHLGELDLARLL